MELFVTVLINLCWSAQHSEFSYYEVVLSWNCPYKSSHFTVFEFRHTSPPLPPLGVDDHAALITLKKTSLTFSPCQYFLTYKIIIWITINLKGPSQPLEIKYMYQYKKIDNSKAIVIFIFKQISLFLKEFN